jgi:hypothetical protein
MREAGMKLSLKVIILGAIGFFVAGMSGCATSNLVDKWHDATFKAPPLSKILVVAVRKDATKRRIWEDAFAGEFSKHGVAATISYSLFPDAPPDTQQVMATVLANGYDGICVILRLPTETYTQYIQPYTTMVEDNRYSFYWQRYSTYYRQVDHPGYTDSQKVALSAIDITTTGKNGRLIWSATSRTPDPHTIMDAQEGIAGLVMTDLTELGVIGPKK